MPLDELAPPQTPLASDLGAGIKAISANRVISFQKYTRAVLPLDGYVFYVKSDDAPVLIQGSLHYATDTRQEAEESYGYDSVVFTTQTEIQDLNEVNPQTVFIGTIDDIRFAFSSRGSFYAEANVYHYRGAAIFPDTSPQVIDSAADLHPEKVIVSDSLPIWLALNGYMPPNPGAGFPMPNFTMYPSFLSPQNLAPPFATVDIEAGGTDGIAAAPTLMANSTHYQLVTDRVKITLWGVRNDDAMNFIDCVNAYSLAYNWFGIMNTPAIRDEKRTQNELGVLAQKKSVLFEISYYQYSARAIARQLILDAQQTFIVKAA